MILHRYSKEKFCLGHSLELKGLIFCKGQSIASDLLHSPRGVSTDKNAFSMGRRVEIHVQHEFSLEFRTF